MNTPVRSGSIGSAAVIRLVKLGVAGLVMGLIGCTVPQVDWNTRIGNYTYDQAVVELGPPDKFAKLTDETVVAEWLTRRGYARSSAWYSYGYPYRYGYGYPYSYYYYPPPVFPYYDTYSPDYFMRLTFGPDGKLQAWKRLVR